MGGVHGGTSYSAHSAHRRSAEATRIEMLGKIAVITMMSIVFPASAQERGPTYKCLVPFGATGNGKSETSNTILQSKRFKVSGGMRSETRSVECAETASGGTHFRVCDLPGLFDTSLSQEQIEDKIAPLADKAERGVDGVLFAIPYGRLREEDVQSYQTLKNMFGVRVVSHTIWVFTKCGDRTEEDVLKEMKDMCSEELNSRHCAILEEVSESSVVAFGNLTPERKQRDRTMLFKVLSKMSRRNGGKAYDPSALSKVRKNREQMKTRIKRLPEDLRELLFHFLEQVQGGLKTDRDLEAKLSEKETKYSERRKEEDAKKRREEEERLEHERREKDLQRREEEQRNLQRRDEEQPQNTDILVPLVVVYTTLVTTLVAAR